MAIWALTSEPGRQLNTQAMTEPQPDQSTLIATLDGQTVHLPRVYVSVKMPGGQILQEALSMQRLTIGTSSDCDLVVRDSRVSRRHLDLHIGEMGVALRDLGSKNGTFLAKLRIFECILPLHTTVAFGNSELVIRAEGEPVILPLAPSDRFGDVLGQSLSMRALFARLLRASPTDETILLLGESGTGKEVLAQEIHKHSRRKSGPFVVLDCAAVAPNLLEAELFGHARGAFSGAVSSRVGLLEKANGGTLFMDEIGELPLDLQPKLLRALESRQVRPLGTNTYKPIDVRVIAATHRNLKAKVNEGSFRQDLYYRLAVVEVSVPPLRDRKEDIELLATRFLSVMKPPKTFEDLPPHALGFLLSHDWPGNVRELRNMVSRLILFPDLLEEFMPGALRGSEGDRKTPAPELEAKAGEENHEGIRPAEQLLAMPLLAGRELLVEQYETRYIKKVLAAHDGNISKAADAMGISRQLLHRLLEKYGIKAKSPAGI